MNFCPIFHWVYIYYFVFENNIIRTHIDTHKLVNMIQQYGKYTRDYYFQYTLMEEILYMQDKIGDLLVITDEQYNIIFNN